MCGIFGITSLAHAKDGESSILYRFSERRGKDSSGLIVHDQHGTQVYRADFSLRKLAKLIEPNSGGCLLGHSRLITDGMSDNQPVVRNNICVLHNGIIVNHASIWGKLTEKRELEIDTEVIAAIAAEHLKQKCSLGTLPERILGLCEGVVSCAILLVNEGKLCLISNNGSLYVGKKNGSSVFASERFPLSKMGCSSIHKVMGSIFLDVPKNTGPVKVTDKKSRRLNLIPTFSLSESNEKLLVYKDANLRRCTKCILPETMPFISFDSEGVCNYCRHYTLRNVPKPKQELFDLVAPYRRKEVDDCIVPFSGGRDSSYALHLVVNELKMKPIAYTYDWAMVTDLARRNISRMCAKLGVENIIVADDITKKREYIAMNLRAWLKSPHLGMISILTAGDKHFFRHIETVKAQTGINLNLWGVNPLEVTHFKAGFLGIPPYFEEKRVYSHGISKQLRYHALRFGAMLKSPGYFNRSLWDTLSGEFFRSFKKKNDYFHIYDYWRWDEQLIENTLDEYDWERAPDTNASWRIGDGTAAFYNYIYYTVAGFTEHDTFRSNQIREGDLTRDAALRLVKEENTPRYLNIKWYLDTLGLDFGDVISVVNSIPRLYEK